MTLREVTIALTLGTVDTVDTVDSQLVVNKERKEVSLKLCLTMDLSTDMLAALELELGAPSSFDYPGREFKTTTGQTAGGGK